MDEIERFSAERALISTASPDKLKSLYEMCCETYAQRFCEMYGFDRRNCFWVSDEPGGVFIINDVDYSLGTAEIKLCVDRSVPFEEFDAWWVHEMENFNLDSFKSEGESINLRSWLNGYHGKEASGG
jgi:hypothetical protein